MKWSGGTAHTGRVLNGTRLGGVASSGCRGRCREGAEVGHGGRREGVTEDGACTVTWSDRKKTVDSS